MTSETSPGHERFVRDSLWVAGSLGLVAVMFGSFGAHLLPEWLARQGLESELIAKRLEQLEIAVRYNLFHALAILALLAVAFSRPLRLLRWAWWCFTAGIVLFSGSLYALVLCNQPKFGMITPLGGVALMVGWVFLVVAARQRPDGNTGRTN